MLGYVGSLYWHQKTKMATVKRLKLSPYVAVCHISLCCDTNVTSIFYTQRWQIVYNFFLKKGSNTLLNLAHKPSSCLTSWEKKESVWFWSQVSHLPTPLLSWKGKNQVCGTFLYQETPGKSRLQNRTGHLIFLLVLLSFDFFFRMRSIWLIMNF